MSNKLKYVAVVLGYMSRQYLSSLEVVGSLRQSIRLTTSLFFFNLGF